MWKLFCFVRIPSGDHEKSETSTNSQNDPLLCPHPTLKDLVKFVVCDFGWTVFFLGGGVTPCYTFARFDSFVDPWKFFWGAHVVMLNRKSSRAEEAEKKVLEEAPGSKAPE